MAGEDDSVVVEARAEAQALRLIAHIIGGESLFKAAEAEGIAYSSAKQLFARQKYADMLRMALDDLRDGIVERARARLEASVDSAVDALVEVTEGKGRRGEKGIVYPKPRDRVVAASAMLDRAGIHPRRTVEHVDKTESLSDAELFRKLDEAVRVLRENGDEIPVEVVSLLPPPEEPGDDLLAEVESSTPRRKPAKVKAPKKPSSRKKSQTKPAKKKGKSS